LSGNFVEIVEKVNNAFADLWCKKTIHTIFGYKMVNSIPFRRWKFVNCGNGRDPNRVR
jgi:hypothetical protein